SFMAKKLIAVNGSPTRTLLRARPKASCQITDSPTPTYLPVIAKNSIPGSPLLTVFWPLFGVEAVVGSLLAARVKHSADVRLHLIAA
ncbi:hypothetical protein AB9F45_35890, partial [Rhizobium leguminosarum]